MQAHIAHPDIVGGASCRRLSLDPYAAARAAAVSSVTSAQQQQAAPHACAAAAAAEPRRGSGERRRSLGARPSASSSSGGGAAAAPAPDNPHYIEVNPLRRMSLPMQGQQARPANELRRGSLPWAPLPTAAAAVAQAS
jgi:hypothetical protein